MLTALLESNLITFPRNCQRVIPFASVAPLPKISSQDIIRHGVKFSIQRRYHSHLKARGKKTNWKELLCRPRRNWSSKQRPLSLIDVFTAHPCQWKRACFVKRDPHARSQRARNHPCAHASPLWFYPPSFPPSSTLWAEPSFQNTSQPLLCHDPDPSEAAHRIYPNLDGEARSFAVSLPVFPASSFPASHRPCSSITLHLC